MPSVGLDLGLEALGDQRLPALHVGGVGEPAVVAAASFCSSSIAAISGWCRSKAGDSERIRGMVTKLCRGGGQLVAHSSERPQPHGSSTSTSGALREI